MGKHRISNLTQKLRAAAAILMVSSRGLFNPGTISNLHAQSPNKAQSSSPPGGPKEGIKVQGRWTIEVRNPDGKLVTRREFNNSLQHFGAIMLNHFLQRTATAGEWRVGFTNLLTGNLPCLNDANEVRGCVMYEPNSQNPAADDSNSFKTLTISSIDNNSNSPKTVLKGTVTAQRDGEIRDVFTALGSCPVNSPGECTPGSTFTKTNIDSISVVTGQIIQVTVVFSFS